jgi:hypothetical protein
MKAPKYRSVTLIMDESSLFKERDYVIIPATNEQQGILLEKYGDTEYHPKTLWGAIAGTAKLGVGFIKEEDDEEIVGRLYNSGIYKPFEISTMEMQYKEGHEPVKTKIVKFGGKHFRSKGDVYEVMAEGEAVRRTEKSTKPLVYAARKPHTEYKRDDIVKLADGTEGLIVNVTKPLAGENLYKVKVDVTKYTREEELGETPITTERTYEYRTVIEDEIAGD